MYVEFKLILVSSGRITWGPGGDSPTGLEAASQPLRSKAPYPPPPPRMEKVLLQETATFKIKFLSNNFDYEKN